MLDAKTRDDIFSRLGSKEYAAVLFQIPAIPQSHQLQSVLSMLRADHEAKLEVFSVDATDMPALRKAWESLNIAALPCVVLFHGDGTECGRVVGADAPGVVRLIEDKLSSDSTTDAEEPPLPKQDIQKRLDALVNSYPVMLFMKGSKSEPFCRFSKQAIAILNALMVDFRTFDVFKDQDVREGMKAYSDWPTFPQLYVRGKFIGGVDIMSELYQSGELASILKDFIPSSLEDRLKMLIHSEPIMVFMKGNRNSPFCQFSRQLMQIFAACGISEFGTFDILQDQDVREGLKTYSSWPTYPQVYVNGKLLGGVDVVKQLIEQTNSPKGLLSAIQELMAS